MKTNVADTSIGAYHGLQHRQTQEDRIYAYVEQHESATIRMVAHALHMEISTVSARINGLRKKKALEYSHTDKDPITGIQAKYWRPYSGDAQMELFNGV